MRRRHTGHSDFVCVKVCSWIYRRTRGSWFLFANRYKAAPDRVSALPFAWYTFPSNWLPPSFGRTETRTVPIAIPPFRMLRKTWSDKRKSSTRANPLYCTCVRTKSKNHTHNIGSYLYLSRVGKWQVLRLFKYWSFWVGETGHVINFFNASKVLNRIRII